jgi:hypothetical protein
MRTPTQLSVQISVWFLVQPLRLRTLLLEEIFRFQKGHRQARMFLE